MGGLPEAALLRLLLLSGAFGLVACSHSARWEEENLRASPAELASGQKMAMEQCGTCHAVARDTQSPMRDAPPFTYLGRNYPISSLAEALAEGIAGAELHVLPAAGHLTPFEAPLALASRIGDHLQGMESH